MAKRRETESVNPLRRDLVSSITRVSGGGVATLPEDKASEESGTNETPSRTQRTKRSRRTPTKWSRATVTMKTRFAALEMQENADFAKMLSKMVRRPSSTGTRDVVTESHITRALWSLARRASDEMQAISPKAPNLKRPPHGDNIGTAEFEDAIADFILLALKRTKKSE